MPSPKPAPLSPPSETTSPASSASENDTKHATQSRALRRPRFATTSANKATAGRSEDGEDEDDEDAPAFLPFANTSTEPFQHDPSATLKGDLRNVPSHRRMLSQGHKKSSGVDGIVGQSQTSDSSTSTSSAAPTPVGNKGKKPEFGIQRERERRGFSGPGPLSPRRTAELARREGSDTGTPSMGSSFSDLDGMSTVRIDQIKTDFHRCFSDSIRVGRSTC